MKKFMLMTLYLFSLPIFTISDFRCACTGNTVECNDGTWSNSHGRGTCSCHGGIKH